jgi:hypothetical protein
MKVRRQGATTTHTNVWGGGATPPGGVQTSRGLRSACITLVAKAVTHEFGPGRVAVTLGAGGLLGALAQGDAGALVGDGLVAEARVGAEDAAVQQVAAQGLDDERGRRARVAGGEVGFEVLP